MGLGMDGQYAVRFQYRSAAETAELEVYQITWETGGSAKQVVPLTEEQVQAIQSEKGLVQPEWHQVCAELHRSGEDDVRYLCEKLVKLRIFDDEAGVMNRSVVDAGGDVLVVSQFTLYASTRKGNRPSYVRAAGPEAAVPLYERFVAVTGKLLGRPVQTGVFGADMQVELVNDGPVTIWIDSKRKEY